MQAVQLQRCSGRKIWLNCQRICTDSALGRADHRKHPKSSCRQVHTACAWCCMPSSSAVAPADAAAGLPDRQRCLAGMQEQLCAKGASTECTVQQLQTTCPAVKHNPPQCIPHTNGPSCTTCSPSPLACSVLDFWAKGSGLTALSLYTKVGQASALLWHSPLKK